MESAPTTRRKATHRPARPAPAQPDSDLPREPAQAGVGRQTIYRWWPTKGAVAAEAMARGARAIVPAHDTGSFTDDLERFLADSFAGLQDQGMRRALRQLVSAAQADEHVTEVLAEFTAHRRAALQALLERGRARGEIPATAHLIAAAQAAPIPELPDT